MCGGLVLAKPGTSFQVLLAILIMLCHLLLVLKLAPYHASTEDWTSFISSFTLTLTTLGGFALISDKGSNVPTFDSDGLAIILVALAGSCIAVNIGITIMFDCGVWDRFCKKDGGGGGEMTKVTPILSNEEGVGGEMRKSNAEQAWD